MGKKITIYDLATKLQVSPGTVSRALNNHSSISEPTKKRIVSKAKELGYRVNKFAANLSNQKSNTIGIIVPKLNSNFMSTVLAGIETVANKQGYNIIISQSLESEEKEKLSAQALFNCGVDALLVSLAFNTENMDHLIAFKDRDIPLLFFDRIHKMDNCPTVMIDNELAGFEATQHLIEQGCRNIVYIGGNLKRNVYLDRFQGYKKALLKHNLSFVETNCIQTDLEISKVRDVIGLIRKMDEKVDGLFVANDTFAIHSIKMLQEAGYHIPKDIKIIGFNNDPISQVTTPSLSTIAYPGYQMGVLAGQSILNYLKGDLNLESTNSIVLRHQLIVRESTKSSNKNPRS